MLLGDGRNVRNMLLSNVNCIPGLYPNNDASYALVLHWKASNPRYERIVCNDNNFELSTNIKIPIIIDPRAIVYNSSDEWSRRGRGNRGSRQDGSGDNIANVAKWIRNNAAKQIRNKNKY